ncbi:head-tail connector protein [Ancylobacter polymorphus]|uniref:Head-tail connector protein n=1 Tax=Ancylobacter polymorphus TaxID=223390 RepID=A0A9E7D4C3_9HYPH|nr:head-tail connector protein [Ancylobacter polymorphus]UOK71707.1 head-tail connector protein [Ancylobacter polymorphus]
MTLSLVTASTDKIVDLSTAKKHLRVDYDDEDTYIEGLIDAAQDWISGENSWLGRSVLATSWEISLDNFPASGSYGAPSGAIWLPRPPIKVVTGLFYTPVGGAEVEITDFRVVGAGSIGGGYVLPQAGKAWPTPSGEPGSVRVEYTAGYDAVPAAISRAVLLLIGGWFRERESISDKVLPPVPYGVEALLTPYRHWGAGG